MTNLCWFELGRETAGGGYEVIGLWMNDTDPPKRAGAWIGLKSDEESRHTRGEWQILSIRREGCDGEHRNCSFPGEDA